MPAASPLIALVDDDVILIELIEEFLMMEGYRATTWSTGAGAVDFIRRVQPELVLLDIRMEEDGAGKVVLDQLRDDPDLRDMPVIVWSADQHFLSMHADDLHARADILHKPFDLDDLLGMISRLLDSYPATFIAAS